MEARQLRPQTSAECYKTFFLGGGGNLEKLDLPFNWNKDMAF